MSYYYYGENNKAVLKSSYNIYIGGKHLPPTVVNLVSDISLDESTDGFDQCTIKFSDPNYSLLNSNFFIEDEVVTVFLQVTVPSHKKNPQAFIFEFEGCISAIDLSFPESGVPEVGITCVDYYSHFLNREERSHTLLGSDYKKKYVTSADYVKWLLTKDWHGINAPVIEGNNYYYRRQDSISQSNSTDISFLQNLAKNEVYPFMAKFIKDTSTRGYTLHYKKKGILGKPVADLYYKCGDFTVISFSPQINKETVKANINEANINLKNKLVLSGKANNKVTYQEVIGKGVKTLGSLNSSSSVVYKDNDDATNDATKLFVDIQYNTLKGEVSILPTVDTLKIKIDRTVNIFGIGNNLSGKYYVTGVKRSLNSSGYSQTLSVIKNGFGDTIVGSTNNKDYWNCGFSLYQEIFIDPRQNVTPVYANEFDGVPLTTEEKSWHYKILDISLDGTRLQIIPIDKSKPQEKKWIYVQYARKVT